MVRGRGRGRVLAADMEFLETHFKFLRRGWKTFARAHSLAAAYILHLKLMDTTLLSIKVFGRSGARLGCCAESSIDDESSSSSDSDEEDTNGKDDGAE